MTVINPVPLELLGASPAIALVRDLLRRSDPRAGLLLVAEDGIELEPVVQSIHESDARPLAPCIVVDCGAACADPIEDRLFGRASDDASLDREILSSDALLASARGGTLFLDNVAELPAGVQSRLARLALDGEATLDGTVQALDVRLIATARPSIDDDLRRNSFRQDLYRRLAGSRIDWPSLRSRKDDIPAIVAAWLDASRGEPGPRASVTDAAISLLSALAWPGNLAELKSVLDAVVSRPHHDPIDIADILPALKLEVAPEIFVPNGNLREARLRFEREYISAVLRHHHWRMSDAAQTLGIQRPNLYRKARQLHIAVTGTTEP